MFIEKAQISVSASLKSDNYGNLFTVCRLPNQELVQSLFDCQQYQQRYFSDKIVAVPIPTTKNGQPVIFTAVVMLVERNFAFYNQSLEKSIFDDRQLIIKNNLNCSTTVPANFAELIVVQRGNSFEITNIKGLPKKEVPPHPYEIVRNRKKNPCEYTYTMEDLCNSVEFWAHHDFITKNQS